MQIKLNFINRSENGQPASVVLFQKDVVVAMPELAVAWKVIRHCGVGCNHPFTYSTDAEIGLVDDYGNYSPRQPAPVGSRFAVSTTTTGRALLYQGVDLGSRDVQVKNGLPRGAINVNISISGKVIATKTHVAPLQMAVFEPSVPQLWIGIAEAVLKEGHFINSALLSAVNTRLSLCGISSADIVMSGGGVGPGTQPFAFALENVVAL